MAIEKIHIEAFLQLSNQHPILDVRSPGEFVHAHIPGAYSLPLFTDEERKIVGTTYKQQSREAAIKIGLDFFGPRMRRMVEEVENLIAGLNLKDDRVNGTGVKGKTKIVLVHCWRGGMRSAAVAWLLDLYGFKVYTLIGGYKFFRRWVLQQFDIAWSLNILGGYTGSGKTEVLRQLSDLGENVIDLESLANHKGSAFGNIGLPAQPSQEMFENRLAVQFNSIVLRQQAGGEVNERINIWLEDESQRIGSINIPQKLWLLMRASKVYFLEIPFSERLHHIVEEYGQLDKERMIAAIERIQKRLGGLETKMTIQFLSEGKVGDAFRVLLKYYDRWYLKALDNRMNAGELCHTLRVESVDAAGNALSVRAFAEKSKSLKKIIDEPDYR